MTPGPQPNQDALAFGPLPPSAWVSAHVAHVEGLGVGLVGVGTSSCGSRLPHPGVDGLHQVLKVRKDVGVGLVAMLGHHLTIYNHVKLAVGSRGKLEVGDMLPGPAKGFACHPGSAEGMPSIPAVEDFQFQLLALSQSTPPTTVNANSMI